MKYKARKTKHQLNGVRIVDPLIPLLVKVTKNDLARGPPGDAASCAVAYSICRQLKAKRARVHLARVYVHFEDKVQRYQTPQTLRTDIILYDHGVNFQEKEYLIKGLSESQRHPNSDHKKKRQRTGRFPKRVYNVLEGVRKSAPRGAGMVE